MVLARFGRVVAVAVDNHLAPSFAKWTKRETGQGSRRAVAKFGGQVTGSETASGSDFDVGVTRMTSGDHRRRAAGNAADRQQRQLEVAVALLARGRCIQGPTRPPNWAMVLMGAIGRRAAPPGHERRAGSRTAGCPHRCRARSCTGRRRPRPDSARTRCQHRRRRSCRRRRRDASCGRRCGRNCG